MGLFKNRESSKAYKADVAKKLDNRKLQYVTERLPDGEIVVGKSGYINVKDNQIIIFCEGEIVFRADIFKINCGNLLSLAGVIISGFDIDKEKDRTLVAYYQYYRK